MIVDLKILLLVEIRSSILSAYMKYGLHISKNIHFEHPMPLLLGLFLSHLNLIYLIQGCCIFLQFEVQLPQASQ